MKYEGQMSMHKILKDITISQKPFNESRYATFSPADLLIFFLPCARLLSSISKEVPVYGFPCKPVFVSKGLLWIFHTPVIMFLNTYFWEKNPTQTN